VDAEELGGVMTEKLADLTYSWIDPRIDFETRAA
jgi:ABC-type microcin C transport system permease subunit YejB